MIYTFILQESAMSISIIITFYNNINILKTCLSNLIETVVSDRYNIEVIIVNDNPFIDLYALEKLYKGKINLFIINMEKNSGYSAACNYGVQRANHEHILLMDCDIFPSGTWLEEMLRTYHSINDYGCVSATIIDMSTNRMFGYGFGIYGVDTIHYLQNRSLDYCPQRDMDFPILSSGCLLMTKSLYLDLGMQNTTYFNAFNDFELTYLNYLNGNKNRMCCNARVFHRGHVAGNVRTNYYADSKAIFFQKMSGKIDHLALETLNQMYASQKPLRDCRVVIVNFSNSLKRQDYVKNFITLNNLYIQQLYDFKNPSGNKIILSDFMTWDICRLDLPILYFTDDFLLLKENYHWFINRTNRFDLIIDRHGNIIHISEFVNS